MSVGIAVQSHLPKDAEAGGVGDGRGGAAGRQRDRHLLTLGEGEEREEQDRAPHPPERPQERRWRPDGRPLSERPRAPPARSRSRARSARGALLAPPPLFNEYNLVRCAADSLYSAADSL